MIPASKMFSAESNIIYFSGAKSIRAADGILCPSLQRKYGSNNKPRHHGPVMAGLFRQRNLRRNRACRRYIACNMYLSADAALAQLYPEELTHAAHHLETAKRRA